MVVPVSNISEEFEGTRKYMKRMISQQDPPVGVNGSEAIVVTYSTPNMTVLFNSSEMTRATTRSAFSAIDKLRVEEYVTNGSSTTLTACLKSIRQKLSLTSDASIRGSGTLVSGRAKVRNNIVLAATSSATIDTSTVTEAANLKVAGAEIVTVAVGKQSAKLAHFQRLSSKPVETHSVSCSDVNHLEAVSTRVSGQLNIGKTLWQREILSST